MSVSKQQKYEFKKGETYMLDHVYKLQGIIPNNTYKQDEDIWSRDGDSGETVLFVKNVTLKIHITIGE